MTNVAVAPIGQDCFFVCFWSRASRKFIHYYYIIDELIVFLAAKTNSPSLVGLLAFWTEKGLFMQKLCRPLIGQSLSFYDTKAQNRSNINLIDI